MAHDERLFFLSVTYLVDLSEVDRHMEAHREWLDENFEAGLFLVSGPQIPRRGGAILARASDESAIAEAISRDPFVKSGIARYDVVRFNPTRGPYARVLMKTPTSDWTS